MSPTVPLPLGDASAHHVIAPTVDTDGWSHRQPTEPARVAAPGATMPFLDHDARAIPGGNARMRRPADTFREAFLADGWPGTLTRRTRHREPRESGLPAEAGRYLFVATLTDLAGGHDSTAPARREGSRRNWTKPSALDATGRPRNPRQGPWRPRPSSRPPVPTSTSVPSTDGNARSVFLTPVLTLAGARTTTWRGRRTTRCVPAPGRHCEMWVPRGIITKMSSTSAEDPYLRDLALLRRVRDRIDREYARPLDVEALARGVNMSAGHLSRRFRDAYGESPYSYLMTRRIERAMALLRRGDLSVTEVCFTVGCSSLGTFSTRFTELVGVPPSVYRRRARATAGMPPCVAKQMTRPIRNQEARTPGPHLA